MRCASSRGDWINSGNGPAFQPIDIGHPDYMGVLEADTAFWSLVRKENLPELFTGGSLAREYAGRAELFAEEMQALRFGLKPSAVYFNCTERCNLNCSYCYIPEKMRRYGRHMEAARLLDALEILGNHFRQTIEDRKPQIIFHGAEPLMNREAMFAGIRAYRDVFRFGIQTNAVLLDRETVGFLKEHEVSIGISIDGPDMQVSDRTRVNWNAEGVFDKLKSVLDELRDQSNLSVICTVTSQNMRDLTRLVEFYHQAGVEVCMLNPVRCTLEGARQIKPPDEELAHHYLAALDRTYQLYQETGRKLIVANFANIILSIVAPSARRLMCDISPCGAGRCFFALAPNGDVFPCSEFIGLPAFTGGNLFESDLNQILESEPFGLVKGRRVEDIIPCRSCAIRHFCGSPCPAEAFEMGGTMQCPGAFCGLYEQQVRYALRLLADQKSDAYLWDGWDHETENVFQYEQI